MKKKLLKDNIPDLLTDEPFELVIGVAIKDNKLQAVETKRVSLPADFKPLNKPIEEAAPSTDIAVNE